VTPKLFLEIIEHELYGDSVHVQKIEYKPCAKEVRHKTKKSCMTGKDSYGNVIHGCGR
jgi:hypothetical protein